MELTEFWTIASANNVVLTLEQIELFKRYHKELIYWNEKVNLISRQDLDNIFERHFLHSLSILKYVEFPHKARCLDIGTGGGFPGLPLKIAQPSIYMLLCDSINKKVKLTDMFAKHTELRNVSAICARVEELKEQKHFDIIVSRAVAQTEQLMLWTEPMLKDNGKFVFLKGGDLDNEIDVAKKRFPEYKFTAVEINMLGCEYFTQEEKKIIVIQK